ncbi:MAG: 30S ribosomal protein S20 [Candidatus Vogelbacteria bacterium]|nr:30S ribosomal protein S20 [Candidatus Vogelbacteria bacterium]
MPIIKSAKKALRSSKRKRIQNDLRRDAMREAIRNTKKATGNEAKAALSLAYQAIDKAAKRGIIKKNAAARKKSRLAVTIRQLTESAKK